MCMEADSTRRLCPSRGPVLGALGRGGGPQREEAGWVWGVGVILGDRRTNKEGLQRHKGAVLRAWTLAVAKGLSSSTLRCLISKRRLFWSH